MKITWWKLLCIALLIYTVIAGLLVDVPQLPLLQETIRNLYFHVCMWIVMMILFTISVVYAIKYLSSNKLKYDIQSRQYVGTGILFGVLGYSTGVLWMLFTWADPTQKVTASFSSVSKDPKLLGAAISLLIYFAYLILRDSITNFDKRAKISAVYNIFAYVFLFPFIWILPRMLPSLHPGAEGNPALNLSLIHI